MPVVHARRWMRKMRGGTQAHLIEADDGRCYVVKFRNNPQGVRVLINEFICSFLLEEMGISAPKTACVEIDDEFLAANPDVCLTCGAGTATPVVSGLHFGSQYPGTAGAAAVYDFLPEVMFHRLYNRAHFLGALVFDKWISNGDGRQAIFFRARVAPAEPQSRWIAQLIDNGHAFQGADWTFRDSPVQGVYPQAAIYGRHISMLKLWPWIETVRGMRMEIFEEVFRTLPAAWITGQEAALRSLLEQLCARRRLLAELVGEWVAWRQRVGPGSGAAAEMAALARHRLGAVRPPPPPSGTATL